MKKDILLGPVVSLVNMYFISIRKIHTIIKLGFTVTTIISLFINTSLLAQEAQERSNDFDFERTIRVIYIFDNGYVVRARPFDYLPQNPMSMIFEAIYPYVYQLEKTENYVIHNFDNMIVENEIRLITPTSSKDFYLGSRWLATDTKVVPISIDDYLQIHERLTEKRATTRPNPDSTKYLEDIEEYTNRIIRQYKFEYVSEYSEFAGWDEDEQIVRISPMAELDSSNTHLSGDGMDSTSKPQPRESKLLGLFEIQNNVTIEKGPTTDEAVNGEMHSTDFQEASEQALHSTLNNSEFVNLGPAADLNQTSRWNLLWIFTLSILCVIGALVLAYFNRRA